MKKTKRILTTPLQQLINTYGQQQVVDQLTLQWKQQAFVEINPHFIEDTPVIKMLTIRSQDLARAKEEIPLLGKSVFIVVRYVDDHHQLLLGRKYLYAAKMTGLAKVPVIKLVISDEEALLILLASMRDDAQSSILGLALVSKKLMVDFGYRQDTLAHLLHYSRPQISNITRLLDLPMNVLKLLNAGLLSYGHAKILVNLPNDRIQSFVDYTLQQQLSVHQLEHLVTQEKKGTIDQALINDIETKFALRMSMNQSSVTLKFKTKQEKDSFLRLLMKENKTF
jgi:ParB/RepB/Spo0J family partition protein